ncbi:MAG: DUF881 domain-containing protein [Frankiaceae bacterium]
MSERSTGWRVAVPVIAGVAGLLFATSAVTAGGTDLRADRRTQLSQLIAEQQGTVAGQQAALRRLQAELGAAGAGVADPRLAAARQRAARLAAPAGMTPVDGSGLRVTLDDAPYRPDDPAYRGVPPDYLVVHQQDVQGVVNALWAGHARAVAIMGHRVVATTVIRCVGNTLWLPGERPYSPPFVITAVGGAAAMRAALAASRAVRIYQQYVDAYGLGYLVREQASLALPAYEGPVQLLYAKVARPSGSASGRPLP